MRGSILLAVKFNENQRSKIGVTLIKLHQVYIYIYISSLLLV